MTWQTRTNKLIINSKIYEALMLMNDFCELFIEKKHAKECKTLLDADKKITPNNYKPFNKYITAKTEHIKQVYDLSEKIANSNTIRYKNEIIDYSILDYETMFNMSLFSPQNIQNVTIRKRNFTALDEETLSISEFRKGLLDSPENKNIVFGRAGIGKTTELLNLARSILLEEKKVVITGLIPIYIKLKNFYVSSRNRNNIIQHIFDSYNFNLSIEDFQNSFTAELNISKRFLFIFDGLNELKSSVRQEGINAIVDFINIYYKHYYIIATRNNSFDLELKKGINFELKYYEILPWEEDQRKSYFVLNNCSKEYQKLNNNIKEICRTPFIANLVVDELKIAMRNNPIGIPNVPNNIGELYKDYVRNRFLHDDPVQIEHKLNSLAEVAYKMNKIGFLPFSVSKLKEILNKELDGEQFESFVLSGIIKRNDRNVIREAFSNDTIFEFTHQSFQEFFTALYLANDFNNSESNRKINLSKLIKNLDDDYWQDVPIYLVGLLNDPKILINQLISENKYWLLAADCIASAKLTEPERKILLENFIEEHLLISIKEPSMHKDAIEIVKALGHNAINKLLKYLGDQNEINKTRALVRDKNNEIDESKEKVWRKYGRIFYILGELKSEGLVDKIKEMNFHDIKDIHLLYHIVIAIYTIQKKSAFKLLTSDDLKNHKDPLVRTFSLLGQEKLYGNDSQLDKEKEILIPELEKNLKLNEDNQFAIIAHSAEALGLLGEIGAIQSLKNLLFRAKRPEPQSSSVKALRYITQKHKDKTMEIISILVKGGEKTNIIANEWGSRFLKIFLLDNLKLIEIKKLDQSIESIKQSSDRDELKCKKIEFFTNLKDQILKNKK